MISYIATFILAVTCPGNVCASHMGDRPTERAVQYAQTVMDATDGTSVDPLLLTALAAEESAWDRTAVSWRGYRYGAGLWQLSPVWHGDVYGLCLIHPQFCEFWHAREASRTLVANKARCGSWLGAVRAYRCGKCRPAVKKTRRVIDLWRRLQRGWLEASK